MLWEGKTTYPERIWPLRRDKFHHPARISCTKEGLVYLQIPSALPRIPPPALQQVRFTAAALSAWLQPGSKLLRPPTGRAPRRDACALFSPGLHPPSLPSLVVRVSSTASFLSPTACGVSFRAEVVAVREEDGDHCGGAAWCGG